MVLSFVTIIPLFIYLALTVFFIWAIATLVGAQVERNKILKEMSAKFDKIESSKMR
jgi:outer membrane lipoprotein-sorting protein